MSVDPVIQSPGNSQSINPYSYIMNNPLAGTDPTGYMSHFGCGVMCDEYGGPNGDNYNCMATCISSGSGTTSDKEPDNGSDKAGSSQAQSVNITNITEIMGQESISKINTKETGAYTTESGMQVFEFKGSYSHNEPVGSHSMGTGVVEGKSYSITATYGHTNSQLMSLLGGLGVASTLAGVVADTTAMNLAKSPVWVAKTKTKGWQVYSQWKGNGAVNFKSFVSKGVKMAGAVSQTMLGIGIAARAGEELAATQTMRSPTKRSSDRQDLIIDISVMAGAAIIGTPTALIAGIGYFAMDYVYDGRFNEAVKDGTFLRDLKTPFYAIRELW